MTLWMECSWNLRGIVCDSLQCSYSNWPSGTKQWIATFFVNGPMMLVNAENGFTTNLKTQQCCKCMVVNYSQLLLQQTSSGLIAGVISSQTSSVGDLNFVCNSRVSARQELAVLKKDVFVLISYLRYQARVHT